MSVFLRSQLVIATRKSELALWQANFIANRLMALCPHINVLLHPMSTEGDERLDVSLAKIGGKGLFVKELESALLSGTADLAVHSIKDMPAKLPSNLIIGAICEREDVRDVLLSRGNLNFDDLPSGAVIGTSSLRRQVQLKALRSDLIYSNLRGNVPTRVNKLKNSEYDAIVLAAAGLHRLGLSELISQYFSVQQVLPACGQGALGIECRENDLALRALLREGLHQKEIAACVEAERSMNAALNGSCQAPIAAFAKYNQNIMHLIGRVGNLDGSRLLEASASGHLRDASKIGETVAKALVTQGAKHIIDEILKNGA